MPEKDTGFADTVAESPFPELEGSTPEARYIIETPNSSPEQVVESALPPIDETLLDAPTASGIVNPETESPVSVHTPDRGLLPRQAPYANTPVETTPVAAPVETYSPAKGGVDVQFDAKGRLKQPGFWKRLLGGGQ
jgi:hypothetical protein